MSRCHKYSDHAAAAAPRTPSRAEPFACGAPTSWFDTLSPEEQERERARHLKREKNAQVAKQKETRTREMREEREREEKITRLKAARDATKADCAFEMVQARAFADGILEAQEYSDGLWYVELNQGVWKQIDASFWCPACEAALHQSTLSSHLSGERHRKAMQRTREGGTNEPMVGFASDAAAWDAKEDSEQKCETLRWQKADSYGIRCLACDKYCDGKHEATPDHARRLRDFLLYLDADYAEPAEPWLAWVACEQWGKCRWLKCLMCNKFVQDLDGTSTEGYKGSHGQFGPTNQKDHRRKLENLDALMRDASRWNPIAEERAVWHPPRPQPPLLSPLEWLSQGFCESSGTPTTSLSIGTPSSSDEEGESAEFQFQ